ncbi:hypothetical protein ES707_04015 [subsurface metagenome]
MSEQSKSRERRSWEAVPFNPQDLPATARFFKEQYGGAGRYGSSDLFRWKILENYVDPGILNLVKDADEVIATTSVTPKRLFFKGAERIVAEIGDTYTHPSYQRQGIFTLLVSQSTKEALERNIRLIYGTPNSKSLPGYEKKASYKTIQGISVKSLCLPLRVKPFIQKRTHWLVGRYADSIFSTAVYGRFLAKRVLSWQGRSDVEEIECIPNEWNTFWERSRQDFDFIFCRDKQAVHWRFFENPNKYRFYVLRKDGQIVGYVVYRIVFDIEVARLLISDFLFLPGHEKDLTVLLFRVLEDALHADVATVNAWCPKGNAYFGILREFGFFQRSHVPVISFQNDFALEVQDSCHTWHFTLSDSDNV